MYQGHCACRCVSFELLREPMFVNCCHCTWCQRETGSAFVINALLETEHVRVNSGELEKKLIPTESGRGQQIFRCAECKTALWSNYGGSQDHLRFIRVGTLTEPSLLPPKAHIFTRSKLPWVQLSQEIPAFEIFYDYETMWKPEDLKRRQACRR